MWRAAKGLGCLMVAWMAGVAPAAAGTVEVAGGDIVFTAAPGEANNLELGHRSLVDVLPITAGPGCTSTSSGSATCTVADDAEFVLHLGDGDDRVDAQDAYRRISAYGEQGDDRLVGGFSDDRLFGGAGDDALTGGELSRTGIDGDDLLEGGPDDDHLRGGPGADTLRGDAGNDFLHGGGQTDTLEGGDDDDVLHGGLEADVVRGGEGRDVHDWVRDWVQMRYPNEEPYSSSPGVAAGPGSNDNNGVTADDGSSEDDWADDIGADVEDLTGGDGSDTFYGTSGSNRFTGNGGEDTLLGRGGADVLDGGSGEDTVDGAEGDDELRGGWSLDVVTGGPGDDVLIPGQGADTVAGGGDHDTLRYDDGFSRNGGVVVRLGQPGAVHGGPDDTASGGLRDTLAADIEALVGSSGDDTLTAGNGAQAIDGGGGDDLLDGGPGADMLAGGSGDDAVSYENRGTRVVVTPGTGGADDGNDADGATGARDTVAGDVEGAMGGAGGDLLVGQEGDGYFDGGPGVDEIRARGGNDVVVGGAGGDVLDGEGGIDTVGYPERSAPVRIDLPRGRGGESGEADTLAGIEDAVGGAGADTLVGDGGDNVLVGGAGGDSVTGGGGLDVLDGEDGDDRLFARDGAYDDVYCGAGFDRADVDEDADDYGDDCEEDEEQEGPPAASSPLAPPAPPAALQLLPPPGAASGPAMPLSVGIGAQIGLRRGVLRVRISGRARAAVRILLRTSGRSPRTLASLALQAPDRGHFWVSVRLTRATRRQLDRSGRRGVRATLKVTMTAGGRTGTATRQLLLRRTQATALKAAASSRTARRAAVSGSAP